MQEKVQAKYSVAIGVIVFFMLGILLIGARAYATKQEKHNICHATASESNPWEAISIADNNHAHDNHIKDYPYQGPTKDNGQPTKDGDAWCEENAPHEEPEDLCTNIDGVQTEVPKGTERNDKGECLSGQGSDGGDEEEETPPTVTPPKTQEEIAHPLGETKGKPLE